MVSELQDQTHLTATGIWRPSASEKLRDVRVMVHEDTLFLLDENGAVQVQWSIATLVRENTQEHWTIYRPKAGAMEHVQIKEQSMIEYLEGAKRQLAQLAVQKSKRLSLGVYALVAAIVAMFIYAVPFILNIYAVQMTPANIQRALGQKIVQNLSAPFGAACTQPEGILALATMQEQLQLPFVNEIHVLPLERETPIILPGGVVVLPAQLIETAVDANNVTAYVIGASIYAQEKAPLLRLLNQKWGMSALPFMISDELPPLIATELATRALATRDIEAHSSFVDNILKDGAWLGLQDICRTP